MTESRSPLPPPSPIPGVRLGDPMRVEALTIFPLLTDGPAAPAYRLSSEAIADGSVTVEEVGELGSVPELFVTNSGALPVLFLEGEELIGAKQNRVVNTSILLAAGSRTKIPVSCVEQGRWAYTSPRFSSGGTQAPSKLRKLLKASVTSSVRSGGSHRSDQGAVWSQVDALHEQYEVHSSSRALSDMYQKYEGRLATYLDQLPYPAGAKGMAVAIGGTLVSVDIYDRAETCEKTWPQTIRGVAFDAMQPEHEGVAHAEEVDAIIEATRELPFEPAPPVGEGTELRAQSEGGCHASALLLGGTLVHGSIVP